MYYRCIHRNLWSGKKDGNNIVNESHACVKGKKSVVSELGDQVRTIAVAEPTKPKLWTYSFAHLTSIISTDFYF